MILSISILAKFSGLTILSIVSIKKQVYPKLVALFYSNLSFKDNVLYSRVRCHEMKILIEVFARVLHLSCEGANIFDYDLEDYEYPENESPYTASHFLHNDDNPALVENEEMNTLTAQVLIKITFHNILPKSDEYSHDRGCASSERH